MITQGVGDNVQDLKFAKLTTNMTAQGPLCKTTKFSCLRYRLFLPSKTFILEAISNEKTFFKTAVLECK